MRKLNIWLIAFSLMMVLLPSCKKESTNSPQGPMRITLPDDAISYYEENYGLEAGAALQTATQAFEMLYPRRYSQLVNQDFDVSLAFYTSNTLRNIIPGYDNQINDTLMYVINFSMNNGYALITDSLDVLAISDTGNITLNDFTTQPILEQYLSATPKWTIINLVNTKMLSKDEQIQACGELQHAYNVLDVDSIRIAYTPNEHVSPLVQMHLGQNSPYNLCCFQEDGAQAVAGCVPIALVTWLAVMEAPDTLASNREFSWEEIKNDWSTYHELPYYTAFNIRSLGALADIIATVGQIIGVDYGTDQTTYSGAYLGETVAYYFYPNTELVPINSITDMLGFLSDNGPLVALGQNPDDYSKGHAWVFDGFDLSDKKLISYRHGHIYNIDYSYMKLIHCDFGWDGEGNGYFDYDLFLPHNGTFLETLNNNISSDDVTLYNLNVNVLKY